MRRTLTIALATLALACSSTTEPDPSICQQTYEFGNFGCGDVNGLVLTRAGTPASGAYLSLRLETLQDGNSPLNALARADTLGRYSMRATWMFLTANGVRPDSAMVWVYAAMPTQPGQPRIADSIQVIARFSAVGERAPVVSVPVLTLPLP
jgi:hypothetical protein